MKSMLVAEGENIYEENRKKLEQTSLGKIVAIEIESREIAGVGPNLDDAYEEAIKKYPKKQFYFRKIGPCQAPGYLF
jgi:hypothetical protein